MSGLPSTLTVFVDPLDKSTVLRPFGHHPALAVAIAYIAMLLTSTVLTTMGVSPWLVVASNVMALVLPAFILIYCYCKPLNVIRANNKWEAGFLNGLQLETGGKVELTNSAELMMSLRAGREAYADILISGMRKTYQVIVNKDEVILFNTHDIDREWALMNSPQGY